MFEIVFHEYKNGHRSVENKVASAVIFVSGSVNAFIYSLN